eukprot:CAMPEP_0170487878 /NCGR_PEP_ID=MMETSP0208-20121228/6593_1 /TAXON_ID=197538 /ORGANISM="Strombidium inclinatum, Strain S3" /LENGTH=119 /DNA_ID=CAMNT_0010762303 /DNA_START=815 /DNA_END=1174 /DNA_ORIENTATION=-
MTVVSQASKSEFKLSEVFSSRVCKIGVTVSAVLLFCILVMMVVSGGEEDTGFKQDASVLKAIQDFRTVLEFEPDYDKFQFPESPYMPKLKDSWSDEYYGGPVYNDIRRKYGEPIPVPIN